MFKEDELDKFIADELNQQVPMDEFQKEEIWNQIESRISKKPERKKVPIHFDHFIKAAAILAFALAGAQTDQGAAIIEKARTTFESEGTVHIATEHPGEATLASSNSPGNSSTFSTLNAESENGPSAASTRKISNPAPYSIDVDEKLYVTQEEYGITTITPKIFLGETQPEVSMTILEMEHIEPQDALLSIVPNLESSYEEVTEPKKTTSPIDAVVLQGKSGNDLNSPITRQYVFSNHRGGTFLVTQNYFLEVAESHAVQFDAMLNGFTILNE